MQSRYGLREDDAALGENGADVRGLHLPRRDAVLHRKRRRDADRLAHRHARRHHAVARVRAVRARDAAASREQPLDALRQECAVADVVRRRLVRVALGLSTALRIVDVDEEPDVVQHGVRVLLPLRDVGVVHLDVARGKGAAALKLFERKIAPFKDNIKTVSMDMASSYASWAASFLPNAKIVIDRFHVIKALTDRVDKARRRVMAMVDAVTAKKIKGNRYLFLMNRESLTPKEERRLLKVGNIKECSTLMEVHLFKERTRSIFMNAKTYADAAPLFDEWVRDAESSDVPELRSAAKTFRRNRDGILAYWTSGGRNNAGTEGFKRKIRGLLETAYGFHDYKFLRLRIFDLGEKKSIKD